MFLFVAFLIFSGAMAAAAYKVWSVPQQRAQDVLTRRLRELRLSGGTVARASADLVRKEEQGRFPMLGSFVTWLGLLRRLQECIEIGRAHV